MWFEVKDKKENGEKDLEIEGVIISSTTEKFSIQSPLPSNTKKDPISEKSKNLSDSGLTHPNEEVHEKRGLFWAISIANSSSQSFVWNFFSAFAALVGVTSSMMGFLTSIRNLISALFQGNIGRLSDKLGRKKILFGGFFLSSAILITLIFVSRPITLVIVSIIQAFSISIIFPVWNATLGDVTKTEQRASYIGKLSAAGTAVSVTLILLVAGCFYITDEYSGMTILGWEIPAVGWQVQYGVAFAIAAFGFLLCIIGILFLPETRIIEAGEEPPKMLVALRDKMFRKFLIINSLFGLMMATGWPIFPIVQIKVLEMTFPQVALISATFSIFSSLSMFFGGRIGDAIGRKPLLIIGRITIFTIPLFFIMAVIFNSWLFLILSNLIGGLSMGLVNVGLNAYVLDLAPENMMGAYSGLTQVVWGIATFIGSLSAGFIAQAIENAYGLRTMAIAMLAGVGAVRMLSSLGYFFITESLPKDVREARKVQRSKAKEEEYIACAYTDSLEECATQTK
ncbi:MAG: MFS transporter [Candidatus Heimdallarchaeota archaeon]|nr:MFS transporter [Candidatus Heimdallarchaeota archaeon]